MRALTRIEFAARVLARSSGQYRSVARCRVVRQALPPVAIVLFAALLFAGAGRLATADGLLAEEEKAGLDAKPEKKSPFLLIGAKVETVEALEDFRRAVRKAAWEKAFKLIETLLAEPAVGLVPSKDGLLVPLSMAVATDLAALPPSGQDAYRLFHDAEAKKLWEGLQNETGPAELTKLMRLSTLDLITSVGDLAANRLGDVLFEQGDMLGAIDAWQRVLEYRIDSSLSRPLLLVKTGVALANAGRWAELDEVERQLKERYPGETVTVAGAKVVAADHVAALIARHQALASSMAGGAQRDLSFDDDAEPVWQFRFEAKDSAKKRDVVQRWGNFGREMIDLSDLPVAAVVTETSLFANCMGCDFAIDLATGKMRWRNGRVYDVTKRIREQNSWLPPEYFTLSVEGDALWTVIQNAPKPNTTPNQNGFVFMNLNQGLSASDLEVVRRDPANGKEMFRTSQAEDLKQYHLIGKPLPVGGMVYLSACKANQAAELHVLAVQAETGRVQWSTHVGTYQFDRTQGPAKAIKPTMFLSGARLYVDAHAGGLVELAAGTGAIRWAYNYPAKMPVQQRQMIWFWGWDDDGGESTFGPSGPLVAGGQLFIKGMQSPRLFALRPDGSALSWKRAVPENAMLAGIDDRRVYLAGEELLAFDLKTQQLLWANNLPFKSASIVPLVTEHRYYQFTPRGIYELDKTTGDVVRLFRGADRDSGGGAILTTPTLLITVSNRAITAYPLKSNPQVATAATGPLQQGDLP